MKKVVSIFGMEQGALILLYDVLWVTLALPLAFLIRFDFELVRFDAVIFDTAIMAVISTIIFWLAGAHRHIWKYVSASNLSTLASWVSLITLSFTVAMFLIDRMDGIARSVIIVHWLLSITGLWVARIMYSHTSSDKLSGSHGENATKPLLLVGGADAAALISQIIRQRVFATDYHIAGLITEAVPHGRSIGEVPVLGRLSDLERTVDRLAVHGVEISSLLVMQPYHDRTQSEVKRLLDVAMARGIQIIELTELFQVTAGVGVTNDKNVAQQQSSAGGISAIFWRGVDIVASGAILIATSPLLLVLALVVRLFISSHVFFLQERPGLHRKRFTVRKFCTMRDPIAPDGRVLPDEERTSWIGKLIRRTRLDELPQLYHVLVGEMSIIGPRPLLVRDLPKTSPEVLARRFSVRPGVTGWAQINGGHSLNADEKLALDLWYINKRSFSLDLQIVIGTIRMMLFGETINANMISEAIADFNRRYPEEKIEWCDDRGASPSRMSVESGSQIVGQLDGSAEDAVAPVSDDANMRKKRENAGGGGAVGVSPR